MILLYAKRSDASRFYSCMFSAKKLLLIGFIIIMLIAIPVTVYFLQQQQETRTQAQAATVLTFAPPSTQASPLQHAVGDTFSLDMLVDPSSNLVSFVRLEIQYDPTKLATASGETEGESFSPNIAAFPSTNEGPVYEEGKVTVSLSVGSDPTKAIQTQTRIGSISFTALEPTDTATLVTYGVQTQVLSIGSVDQASENVLSSTTPAAIVIAGETTPTPSVTETPTITPSVTITETPTPSASPTSVINQIPVCSNFTANPASGSAPLSVTFSSVGNDPDGSISQIAYNFGDGNVTTITEGLGTASIQNSIAHTFNGGGTFTASAVMTDNSGATSVVSSCQQTLVISGAPATPTATLVATGTSTPTPTIVSPGPGGTIIGIGAFFTVLSVIGALLFFAL